MTDLALATGVFFCLIFSSLREESELFFCIFPFPNFHPGLSKISVLHNS